MRSLVNAFPLAIGLGLATSLVSGGVTAQDAGMRAELQRLSPRIAGETLHVYSPPGEEARLDPMVGRRVSAATERSMLAYLRMERSHLEGVYAVYWAPLGRTHEMYLLRTPSQNAVTSLRMLLVDLVSASWVGSIEVADSFGDEGWSFDKQAWLLSSVGSDDMTVIIRRVDRHLDLDSDALKETVGPDSLYALSVRRWLVGDKSPRALPDSLRRRFTLVRR